ncbi:hypothetical protein DVH24_035298 [Malus domestica]|uniref:Uncharacterized protein n=1 Tax=Malus domestica TaxID=3750 RepID=A0A498J8Q9_MALDO|nr:hypothetical protein DVH24_035298 [Malus domestica]
MRVPGPRLLRGVVCLGDLHSQPHYRVDPKIHNLSYFDDPSLSTHRSNEFPPFVCRLPDFKFW